MFERNRVESLEHGTLCAKLSLTDGEDMTAKIVVPPGRGVFDVLNGTASFVEIEAFDGERSYVAKAALKSVKFIAVARAPALAQRTRDLDGFDPHTVLGLEKGAEWEAIKQAYHALAKAYHPDRFASLSLPGEVQSYVEAMARRVNAAFAALEAAEAERARRARPRAVATILPFGAPQSPIAAE